jgi:hypothetical protein
MSKQFGNIIQQEGQGLSKIQIESLYNKVIENMIDTVREYELNLNDYKLEIWFKEGEVNVEPFVLSAPRIADVTRVAWRLTEYDGSALYD